MSISKVVREEKRKRLYANEFYILQTKDKKVEGVGVSLDWDVVAVWEKGTEMGVVLIRDGFWDVLVDMAKVVGT